MTVSYRFAAGPVHLLRLETGSDLYDSIEAYAIEHAISTGWISHLGAVRKASLRYYDQVEKVYRDFEIDEHLEVLAGTGNITLLDGKPFVHTHAVFSDGVGRAFGGHINRGTEVFSLEVRIEELVGDPIIRQPDDTTGLALWCDPSELT